MFQCRKFNFFDLRQNVDEGRIKNLFKVTKQFFPTMTPTKIPNLQENEVVVTTSGNNQLVFGDDSGQIHLISRNWQVVTFRAYEICVNLAYQLRNSPLLVTIGVGLSCCPKANNLQLINQADEPGVNPLIKVWDTSRHDKAGTPFCHRISRAIPGNRPVNATTICVHEDLQLLAVGFTDGSLILYR